ncbi:MAG: FAD-dependent oxidoreductase, partial [Planctomycetaceae bacterium]|nr:FAD-dependent oxidoreductase [Planctomycetaceae bacterium]
MTNPLSQPRRTFLKSVVAGAVLSQTGLTLAANGSADATAKVSGEVLRTSGALSAELTSLTEAPREIPVAGRSSVLVCGGGPAGVAAALAAARAGADVRLVELAGCLGGVWTAGLLTKILDGSNKSGIMKELLQLFAERGSAVAKSSKGTVYDPEIAKLVLEELLVDAGVRILLHTRVVGAVTDANNRLAAI